MEPSRKRDRREYQMWRYDKEEREGDDDQERKVRKVLYGEGGC